eukprot:SAG31_NODE_50_length_30520_cov_89.906712_5_plen_86_part_00
MQRAAENHSDLLTQLQEAKIEAATEAKARVAAESRADALADANTTLSRCGVLRPLIAVRCSESLRVIDRWRLSAANGMRHRPGIK